MAYRTLYDALHPEADAPTQEDTWPKNPTAKEFADLVLSSVDFRNYIVTGLKLGSLPAAVVTRLMDYSSWGVPTKKIEIEDKTPQAQTLSDDELFEQIERYRRMKANMQDSVH